MTKSTPEPLKLDCPTCGNKVLWTDDFPYRPFCSERCKMIDLGEWASENHKIPGEPVDINDEDLER
ncbi:DNA gyrase inhibitor YacG [Marinimicrobium agarilyticum]|uniref:DNA gyrase inhibitor YacG n=1 Tax=Marinimicrobium agarilyticum TaxID=306546 RepID=UPI000406FDD1|nr:DNA gyrase inhibitor YacG [Marinimicrobium agarilyticum]